MPRNRNNARNPNTSYQGVPKSGASTSIADITSKFSFGQKRKFDDKSKKKKTYIGRCKRLLNNMLELDDSRPFRTAVDKLKFPDYHTSVRYDIDLSKIATKLDTGQYVDPKDFGRDIRLMVQNWNEYIKDASQPIYGQITRLSWWFEAEFSKIVQAHDDHKSKKRRIDNTSSNSPSTPGPSNPDLHVNIPTPPHLMSSVVENGRLKITRAPRPMNKGGQARPAAQVLGTKSSTQPTRNQASAAQSRFHWKRPGTSQNATPTTTAATTTPTTTSSSGTLVTTLRVMNAMREAMNLASRAASSPATTTPTVATAASQRSTAPVTSASRPAQLVHTTPTPRVPASSASSSASMPSVNSPTVTPAARPAASASKSTPPQKKNPEIELMFSATHVWYGEFKNKPQKDIRFTELGLEFPLKFLNNETTFHVQPSDIVRCCGHFGNLGKLQNTLFLFLSPACTKRLKQAVDDLGITLQICSLIVIFGQNLTMEKISRLIHIFWVMSRSSVFGQLFSEVDKKGALSILANIKPQILQKLSGAQTPSGTSTPVSKDGVSPATGTSASLTVRPMPNLSRAVSPGSPRVRRHSSTDAVASSTTPDRFDHENRALNNRSANSQSNMNHGYTFQRSRLPGNQKDSRLGHHDMNHFNEPGPFGNHQRRDFSNSGRYQSRGKPTFSGPNRPQAAQPRFGLPARNYFQNYSQSFQKQQQPPSFPPPTLNEPRNSDTYDQFDRLEDGPPPWLRNHAGSNPQVAGHNFSSFENPDFPQDSLGEEDMQRIESFCQDALSRISYPVQQTGQTQNNVQMSNGYQPTAGVSSTGDQNNTHSISHESETDETASIRSVEVVRQTDSENSTHTGARDQILVHFSHSPTPDQNHGVASDVNTPPLVPDPMLASSDEMAEVPPNTDNINVESSVSSTDQTVTAVMSDLARVMPHLTLPDQDVSDIALEPVSSSAPPDITGDAVDGSASGSGADEVVPASAISGRADSVDFGSDQVDVASSISDDDDLEIIIPSDNEDDLAFVPARQEKAEDGEDLVMTATRISTKCPVTQQMMRRPVKNRHCGHCYDRDGIQQLIINRTTKARCPVPGCSNPNALVMADMDFDQELFDYIRTHNNDKDLQRELDIIHKEIRVK